LEGILSLAVHPTEEQILYGGELGGAKLYKISDNQGRTAGRNDTNLLRAFERQPGPVSAVAFSPDGKFVALGSVGEIRVYDINDGSKAVLTLSGIQGPVYAVTYKPDGSIIATGGADGQVRLFDSKSGNQVKLFVPVPLISATTEPAVIAPPAK
jgi:WD40 repeat protein